MFTCSNPEDLLFPLDSPPNQLQQQQINNLQKRCLKLENDCQRYEQFLTSLKAEYEQKIRLFVDEKEREFHQLGTAHAMKLQDMENKYLQKLQNRSDDIIEYQLEIQEKSAHLLTLTHEIEALQDQREEMELRFVQKYQRLSTAMEQLQSSLEIEQDNSSKLCQENESLLLSVDSLQQEKDALHAQIDELVSSKDAVVSCIQKLTKENHRLKQKFDSSPRPSFSTPLSNPTTPRSSEMLPMIDCPTASDKTFSPTSPPRSTRRGLHKDSPVTV